MEVDKAGSVELNWVHKDRLGSITAITGENGELKERLSYDTWGKRRTLNGSATPDNLDGQLDNKGYTGHEMLDGLDLVHMNGRVYDPLLARFVSPDPLVQDPFNGQSYNRYSYVLNNPTKLTDPTGFASVDANSGLTTIVVPGSGGSSGDMLSVINNSSGASRELNRATPRVNPKSGGVTNKTTQALKFVLSTAKRAGVVAFAIVTSGNEFQKNTEDEEVAAMHARAAAENALRKDGEEAGKDNAGDTKGDTNSSPDITHEDLGGKTQEEIEQMAQDKGLVRDPRKPNKWRDPETGEERIRIDPGHIDKETGKPYDNPRAAQPHVHGYDQAGKKIGDPGAKNDPHFPLRPGK